MVDNYELLFCNREHKMDWYGWIWTCYDDNSSWQYPGQKWHKRQYTFSKGYNCGASSDVWYLMCNDCARRRGLEW